MCLAVAVLWSLIQPAMQAGLLPAQQRKREAHSFMAPALTTLLHDIFHYAPNIGDWYTKHLASTSLASIPIPGPMLRSHQSASLSAFNSRGDERGTGASAS